MPISRNELRAFAACLKSEDRSPGTIGKYLHDGTDFAAWLGNRTLNKENASAWREHLVKEGYVLCFPSQ